jgi:hypothetical protein
MDSDAPRRQNVRKDIDDARLKKSNTDMEEPSRAIPQTAIEAPSRMKALKEREEPR